MRIFAISLIAIMSLCSASFAQGDGQGTLPAKRYVVTNMNLADQVFQRGSIQIGTTTEPMTASTGATGPGFEVGGPVMTQSWRSGPFDMSVTTSRKTGENAEQQAQRHRNAVQALVELYPPTN